MPKKTTHARSGAQRGRTRQKSFELVRPVSDSDVRETIESSEEDEEQEVVASGTISMEEKSEVGEESEPEPVAARVESAPKSAAARLAARRQAAQRVSQRSTAALITAEHYSYVRKDLMFILILAIIMFSAIIIMHFIPAIGG